MSQYSKYNVVYRLQKWMDSVPGQTFLNYAYSWGASIVIFGTLCKLTHLPWANFWLFLGMGTEVFVFFISAFDRPFDKTAEGRDLPTHFEQEAEGEAKVADAGENTGAKVVIVGSAAQASGVSLAQGTPVGDANAASAPIAFAPAPAVSDNPEMAQAQSDYVEELKKLVETLGKVNEQSERLTRDSEEMENLNRTLTGISRVYEMQLKSASQQITTIDQINEQSRKMAQQIEQLNMIYTRMIEAMTVNMRSNGINNTQG